MPLQCFNLGEANSYSINCILINTLCTYIQITKSASTHRTTLITYALDMIAGVICTQPPQKIDLNVKTQRYILVVYFIIMKVRSAWYQQYF